LIFFPDYVIRLSLENIKDTLKTYKSQATALSTTMRGFLPLSPLFVTAAYTRQKHRAALRLQWPGATPRKQLWRGTPSCKPHTKKGAYGGRAASNHAGKRLLPHAQDQS